MMWVALSVLLGVLVALAVLGFVLTSTGGSADPNRARRSTPLPNIWTKGGINLPLPPS